MELSKNEIKKYLIIEKIVKGEITKKEAELELDLSRRQIDRLILKFLDEGKDGFYHKNKGISNVNKTDRKLIEKIEDLYLDEYYDYSIQAFYEELVNKHNIEISYSVVLNEFKKDDIISPYANKKTIKLYNEKMKQAIESKEEAEEKIIELYNKRILETEKVHIRRTINVYGFGEEIQMDATFDIWFGNEVLALHLAVDKATKKILFGWFEKEEVTRGYFVVLYNTIIHYGIPKKIKTDKRSSFNIRGETITGLNETQFSKICKDLNIELKTSSIATFKPNVERENGTVKRRLKAEFRRAGISTIKEANKYLNEDFIPRMNQMFSYEIDKSNSKMRDNHYAKEELNLIISERKERVIDGASTIHFNNKCYQPYEDKTGEIICFKGGTKCEVIITYNGQICCKIDNNYYQLLELENRDKTMNKERTRERRVFIPPADHVWK